MSLSVMETQLGLTIVSSFGQLRVVRHNPAYNSCKAILTKGLPAAQAWQEISELAANPLKSFYDWLVGFGYQAKVEDGFLTIDNFPTELSIEKWKPHFDKVRSTAGSPEPSLQFAKRVGNNLDLETMKNLCIHWQASPTGYTPRFAQKRMLPEQARPGDLVTAAASGNWPFLVSYDHCVSNGNLVLEGGMVFKKLAQEDDCARLLAEPVILGTNRTYRCEEGDPSGWLEDLSFDSLVQARANLKEITQTGAEGRIINRISGLVVV